MQQGGQNLIAISQQEFAKFQAEKEILQTKLNTVTNELAKTKEKNKNLERKIGKLEVSKIKWYVQ